MPIAPFPHHYVVTLNEAGALCASPKTPISSGAPPQFGGSDRVWSPEELLIGSLLACVRTTFDAYAKGSGLSVAAWRGSATGTLEKTAGGPAFSSFRLHIELEVNSGDEERAKRVLERAERDCIISHAVKPPVVMTMEILTRAVEEVLTDAP